MQENIFTISFDKNNYCQINLTGGGVMDLYLSGKKIFYSGQRPDGGSAFTHPCIPNFNIAQDMPNHGPARKEQWEKVSENTITWEMTEIPNIYPQGIVAERSFAIGDKYLTVTTRIKNTGEETLPTNIAEHNYFACPSEEVKNVMVNGNYFHPEALRANAQFNPWQDKNIIYIPNIGEFEFNISGYQAFAQWSQPNAPFACIEPIEIMPPQTDEFHTQSPKIKPGESKTFSYTIRLI